MPKLLFGTAGIPHSTYPQNTVEGIKEIARLGLDCMEIEFVRSVYLKEVDALLVAREAQRIGISLSAHAPYYLNFNSHDPQKLRTSQGNLYRAARIASICGAHSLVFHPGFYMGDPLERAYGTVKEHLTQVVARLKSENSRLCLRPEVSGKGTQFGTIEEIIKLSNDLEGVAPCVDFAHWHARSGAFNSYDEFISILDEIMKKLGKVAIENMHIHIAGIAYGARGELRHLPLNESDLRYVELLRALKDTGAKGMVICESPNLEEDALLLKESYLLLAEKD
jgi:deoxyribonuclease-4